MTQRDRSDVFIRLELTTTLLSHLLSRSFTRLPRSSILVPEPNNLIKIPAWKAGGAWERGSVGLTLESRSLWGRAHAREATGSAMCTALFSLWPLMRDASPSRDNRGQHLEAWSHAGPAVRARLPPHQPARRSDSSQNRKASV